MKMLESQLLKNEKSELLKRKQLNVGMFTKRKTGESRESVGEILGVILKNNRIQREVVPDNKGIVESIVR